MARLDQDSSFSRNANGEMALVTNKALLVAPSDVPGGNRLHVNVGPYSRGRLESNGTNVGDGHTVTIGSVTYRFKDPMEQANDVKRGGMPPLRLPI